MKYFHYLVSVDAGEICADLYMIFPKTMLGDEHYERFAFETNQTLARALLEAGHDGPTPPSPTIRKLARESQDEVEALLREHLACGDLIDEFKAGKQPMLRVALAASADNPCCAALMALHRTLQ